jgi:hypothetical protein
MGYGLRAVLVVALLALVCRWGVAQVGPRYVIELPGGTADAATQGRLQLAGKGLVLMRFQDLRLLAVAADGEAYSQESVQSWPAADLVLVLPASAGRYDGVAPLEALRNGVPVVVAQQASAGAERADLAGGANRGADVAGGPRLYPMQPWNALDLRKHGTRLRVTAMPGPAGTVAVAGYLIEVGNSRSSYRLYAGAVEDEAAVLAQRLPGADMALLPGHDGPQLLALNRGAPPARAEPAALTAAGHVFKPLRR